MKTTRTCTHCQQTFLDIEGKVFACHVRWCPENKTNGDKGKKKSGLSIKEFHAQRIGHLKDFPVSCEKCNNSFLSREREKLFPSKKHYFCSRQCANSRGTRSEQFKDAVRAKLTKERETRHCKICDVTFEVSTNRTKNFCSRSCYNRYRYLETTTPLKDYRKKAAFNFSLSDFPNEFDFSLIEQYGWYKAKNHGDNLNGVSRDHMVSVMFGFKHAVDPSIISHPANCRLVRHNDNVSKGRKCLITIDDLILRIKEWDKKYGRL